MSKDFLYPLRRIHGELYENQRKRKIDKYLRWPLGQKVYILGSPVYTNLGDSAILLAQIHFINKIGITANRIKEVTFSEYYQNRELVQKVISSNALICGLGGGNMGNQWPVEEKFRYDMLNDFPNNPMIIFPQTIYFLPNSEQDKQNSVEHYNTRKNFVLVAREKVSLGIMQTMYPNANVLFMPDIVLYATMETFGAVEQERSGVLFCVRSDAEKSIEDAVWTQLEEAISAHGNVYRKTDMYSDCPVTKENRAECVRKKMQEFCGAELVITDRLHGMVFAAITGTPCVVFSNYNHKVKGTYDWISYLPYIRYVETVEQAKMAISELIVMRDCHFNNEPLNPYFEKLAEVVKEICPR